MRALFTAHLISQMYSLTMAFCICENLANFFCMTVSDQIQQEFWTLKLLNGNHDFPVIILLSSDPWQRGTQRKGERKAKEISATVKRNNKTRRKSRQSKVKINACIVVQYKG
ncbi:hypothetical protein RvY_18818 [Ramazzottius varieornatus]|uniref:Secreted protein n=1 Tax=Ramazzottius varieornatus TaxID=947166 RepID=A0A1D1W7E7_RAMVA|nr:hypothetical protein RvY_18818 [Ramazzottius varieornatus]